MPGIIFSSACKYVFILSEEKHFDSFSLILILITLRVGGKRKKMYLYDSRFIMRLSGGVWYLNNFESAKRYVDFFVDCVLGEMLK